MKWIVAQEWARRLIGSLTLFVAISFVFGEARAQSIPPPPVRATVDVNGVDLVDGSLRVLSPSISIGQPGSGALVYARWFDSSVQAWRDNYTGTINSSGTTYTVTLFGSSQTFTLSGGVYTPSDADGSSLTFNSANNEYTYTSRYGAVAIIDKDFAGSSPTQANEGRITSYTEPNGERTVFTYVTLNATTQRLQSVTNNFGYQLKFDYFDNSTSFLRLVRVTALNNAVDYCNPSADTCSYSQTWPNLQFNAALPTQITDALNRVTTYGYTSSRITSIESPEGVTLSVSYSTTTGRVTQVTDGDGTWTYNIPDPSGERTVSVTNPVGSNYGIEFNASNTLASITNGGLVTSYYYDANNRLTIAVAPTGVRTFFFYDARGNVTQTSLRAPAGSGLANIDSSASFPSTCTNERTCNLPESTTDSRGFRTDYSYDPTHGGLLTITAPAPTGTAPVGSGARPQTRFTYDDFSAYYKDGSGSIVAAPSQVWLPIETSACATTSSCDAGADETLTLIDYGANGVANNRLPVSETIQSGSGSVTSTTAFSYDGVGNVLTVDGPLSGTDDTTRIRYDAMRQTIGVVGPDPDAGGSGLHRAQRLTYNEDGQVTITAQGTVTSQSDAAWANFATLEEVNTAYDAQGRPTVSAFVAQSATQAVMQYAYDDASRLLCQTVRMNPAAFGSLPSSACTLGTQGSHGPDRITRFTYDFNNQITQVTTGYGTGSPINEVTTAYDTSSALPITVTDGASNRTTYEYDGFARLTRTYYPRPDLPNTSSITDYEQYTYNNAASVVTQVRRRDGQTIAFSYDNLLRVTEMTPPDPDEAVAYTYDLFSRQLTAVLDPTGSPQTQSFAYDQLSRVTSAGSPLGTVSYQYDAASRRTRMMWPDSFYVDYDYDLTNAVTGIRENGATSGAGVLATFSYDNLGRRTQLSRAGGNGAITTYAFDPASRLATLTQNFSGTTSDLTRTLDYNAGAQIVERESSNAAYNTPTPYTGTTNYLDNGLNQYTGITQAQPTYDARGNMTRVGLSTYSYDIFNRLTSATPAGASQATFAYDALGRLRESVASSTTTRFLYDGAQVIGEYNGSNALQRRYVFGPGVNEPLVWYEGAGASDRRWLIGDERGSVIAVTNSSGAATNVNAYDEYGVPASSNVGTFQYTGQMWLQGAQLYHYRARAYSAALGRFMQTDPIGFAGGINLYAYVGNDPVNRADPMGLQWQCDVDVDCSEEIIVTAQRPTWSSWFDLGEFCAFNRSACAGYRATDAEVFDWLRVNGLDTAWDLSAPGATLAALEQAMECLSNPDGCDASAVALALALRRLGCGCFEEGTLVATPEGLRRIEEIQVGDQVFAWDPATGGTIAQTVTALIRPEAKPLWRLEVRNNDGETEVFHATDDHPWFIEGVGWVETQSLGAGQRIETADDRGLSIIDIARTDRVERTFNLSVEGLHTFLVGENGAVVHNACPLGDLARRIAAWLGPFRVVRSPTGNYIFTSVDGLRRVRIDFSQQRGRFMGAHAQFELRAARNRDFAAAPGVPAHVYFRGRGP